MEISKESLKTKLTFLFQLTVELSKGSELFDPLECEVFTDIVLKKGLHIIHETRTDNERVIEPEFFTEGGTLIVEKYCELLEEINKITDSGLPLNMILLKTQVIIWDGMDQLTEAVVKLYSNTKN